MAKAMAKAQRSSSDDKGDDYVLTPPKGDKPATLRHKRTGEVLVLHGYGSMKGQLEVREGIDLTKPIYEQVLKLEKRKKRKATAKRRARRKVPMAQSSVLCYATLRCQQRSKA